MLGQLSWPALTSLLGLLTDPAPSSSLHRRRRTVQHLQSSVERVVPGQGGISNRELVQGSSVLLLLHPQPPPRLDSRASAVRAIQEACCMHWPMHKVHNHHTLHRSDNDLVSRAVSARQHLGQFVVQLCGCQADMPRRAQTVMQV